MDYFSELPVELIKQILQDWLSVGCLVRTELAYRASRSFSMMSSILASGLRVTAPLYFDHKMNFNNRERLILWILARHIQLSEIIVYFQDLFTMGDRTDLFHDLFATAGPCLLKYTGNLCPRECIAMANNCSNLSELCMIGEPPPNVYDLLRRCTKLTKLHLTHVPNLYECNPSDNIHLPLVTDLSLESIRRPDLLIGFCAACPNVKRLKFTVQSIREVKIFYFNKIARCVPQLQHLDIADLGAYVLSDDDLLCFVRHCPNITELKLRQRNNFTDVSLVPMVQTFRLTHLDLESVTAGCLQALAQHCAATLVDLNLTFGRKEQLPYLLLVTEKCTCLKSLSLTSWYHKDLPMWTQVLANLHNIEHISLKRIVSANFNNRIAETTAQHCPKLRTLSVVFCGEFSSSGLLALLRGCPLLVAVQLDHVIYDRCMEDMRAGHTGNLGEGIHVHPWTDAEKERAKRVVTRSLR